MAFAATGVWRRGAPAELMNRFLRWRDLASARVPNVSGAPGETARTDVMKKSFAHWRNAATERWNPPKYSLRRQKQLVSAAYATGMLDEVAASPKHARLAQRLAEQASHEVFTGWPAFPPQVRLHGAADAERARAIALKAHTRGPYSGRAPSRMFKGTKAERSAGQRRRRIEANMAKMDEMVQEWRNVRVI